MTGRERLHTSTCGTSVRMWAGQVLAGPELAIAVQTAPVTDHHIPAVIRAAATNGIQTVIISSRDLAKFLQAHRELTFIIGDAQKTFWVLKECCTLAGVDCDFLWNKLNWRLCDVVLLDELLRLPRPQGELTAPRTIQAIASELSGVHTLLPALRIKLEKLMQWRHCRAVMDEFGFLAGEAQGLYYAAQLLRQLEVYGSPALFTSAQEHFGEHWFDILQRIIMRSRIAQKHIYMAGLAMEPIACMKHKAQLLEAAGLVADSLRQNRVTKALFPPAVEGQANNTLNMDGARLMKLLTSVQRRFSDLPQVPHSPGGVDQIDPMLVSLYGEYKPVLKEVALFLMDKRLFNDMLFGEDGRLRLRHINLPQAQWQTSAFDFLLQKGHSRILGTSPQHALLLACVVPCSEMHLDLAAALTLSASLELSRRGYRIVAHTEGSLVIEAAADKLTVDSQRLVEKVIAEHIGRFVMQPSEVVVACRRVSGWEEVENILLKDEARTKLGKPPWGS